MGKPITFQWAINHGIAEEMRRDPTVFIIGEDVGKPGGPFGVTRGLLDKFGPERVRDTPISEAAITGAAVGAAMTGLRPVVEIMFMDFVTLIMDALVNQAAKARFMFGGQSSVPMVVRMPHGGGINAGPQHSQCLEAWLAHVPGLKVVCPATVADAYGLTRAAILDDDPVIAGKNHEHAPALALFLAGNDRHRIVYLDCFRHDRSVPFSPPPPPCYRTSGASEMIFI